MDEFRPCPFCGSKYVAFEVTSSERQMDAITSQFLEKHIWGVKCGSCNAKSRTYGGTVVVDGQRYAPFVADDELKKSAREAWNRRSGF